MDEEEPVEKKPARAARSGEAENLPAVPEKPRPPLAVRALVASTMTGLGLIAALYLIFPTMGIVELIPDNIPFLGNLDEAGATALMLMVLSYWGMDVTRLGRGISDWSRGRKALPPPEESA
jgi:hypothetical protein